VKQPGHEAGAAEQDDVAPLEDGRAQQHESDDDWPGLPLTQVKASTDQDDRQRDEQRAAAEQPVVDDRVVAIGPRERGSSGRSARLRGSTAFNIGTACRRCARIGR
jgi:hypothetical protein